MSMSIGEALKKHRFIRGESQEETATRFNFDRSTIAKVENGQRPCPPELEKRLIQEDWRFALKVADERTGGWISNLVDKSPHLDLHPSALKEVLLRELHELKTALEGTELAKYAHATEADREKAAALWLECKDVSDKVPIVMGVLEEVFGLKREPLIERYEAMVRRGER